MIFSKKIITLVIYVLLLVPNNYYFQNLEELQREFTELRFGAFFHFGIRTFTGGEWGEANQDISKFNPTNLDCNQWVKALVSAKMKFGILTTKHHDGFCLWDSKYTNYDVASIPWRNGKGDVLREFVDAFRKHNLEPCFYYSIWDNTAGIGNGEITHEQIKVIKGQIKELLTNYGDIGMLFLDGWSWKMGHKKVPYDEIRALVKRLQPKCLLVDNTHLSSLYNNDLIHYEAGGKCPANNTKPALLSQYINKDSGNGWFWDKRVPTAKLLTVEEIVDTNLSFLEPRWCTFILNCPPNQEGKLDNNIVERLREVGNKWQPNYNRPKLPKQQPQIEFPITPISATATSDTASFAIDGLNDRYYYTVWESDKNLPQSVKIDLGKECDNVGILCYVPKYIPIVHPLTEGSIKSYKIYKSIDGNHFEIVKTGEWNGDVSMKVAEFTPTKARFIRLEALSAVNDFAAITEVAIGRIKSKCKRNKDNCCKKHK